MEKMKFFIFFIIAIFNYLNEMCGLNVKSSKELTTINSPKIKENQNKFKLKNQEKKNKIMTINYSSGNVIHPLSSRASSLNPNMMNYGTNNSNIPVYKGNCYIQIEQMIFDLTPLNLKNETYSFISNDGSKIDFNMCSDVLDNCNATKSLVVDKEKCIEYTGSSNEDKTWNYITCFINFQEKSEGYGKLFLSLPSGEKCGESSRRNVNFELICDQNSTWLEIINPTEFDSGSCSNTLTLKSKYACPNNKLKPWYADLYFHKYVIASFLITSAVFFIFFAMKLVSLTAFLILSTSLGKILHTAFPFSQLNLITCLIIGGLIASLIIYYVGMFYINLGFAIVLGFYIRNILNTFSIFSLNPWVAIIIYFTLMFAIFYYLQKLIILLTTSLTGAYSVTRFLGIIFDTWKEEMYIEELIKHNESRQANTLIGPYLLKQTIILSGLTIFAIYWHLSRNSDEKEEAKI